MMTYTPRNHLTIQWCKERIKWCETEAKRDRRRDPARAAALRESADRYRNTIANLQAEPPYRPNAGRELVIYRDPTRAGQPAPNGCDPTRVIVWAVLIRTSPASFLAVEQDGTQHHILAHQLETPQPGAQP